MRSVDGPDPVRLVHLGLGNFFRAHQAWYTHRAPDGADWGYAAFTGRRPGLADLLQAQGGRYTLVTRGPVDDTRERIRSLSAVRPGSDHEDWLAWLSRPDVAVVTITVTEAGYVRDARGDADRAHPLLAADIAALREDLRASVVTAPGKLVAGLAARRAADAGPIAVVPCDNLMDNGRVAARCLAGVAEAVEPALAAWIADHTSFVTTVVDRITPRPTPDEFLPGGGGLDRTDVVTEPFHEWVISGSFPAGRPQWDLAGARFTDRIAPFEQRKLWLLNGGHSLLAYAGSALGHASVADAMADARLRSWLAEWWTAACRHVPLPAGDLADYCAATAERFENARIVHRLRQIAADGSQKLPIRVLPVLRAEREQGRMSVPAARVLGAWVAYAALAGPDLQDPRAAEIRLAAGGPDGPRRLLALLDPALADDGEVVAEATRVARELQALAARGQS